MSDDIAQQIQGLLLETTRLETSLQPFTVTGSSLESKENVWKHVELDCKRVELQSLLHELVGVLQGTTSSPSQQHLERVMYDKIWKQCFYPKIAKYKRRIQQGTKQCNECNTTASVQNLVELCHSFQSYLLQIIGFYQSMLNTLTTPHHMQQCLVYLGDLTRYLELSCIESSSSSKKTTTVKDFSTSRAYYEKAIECCPGMGQASNQVAILCSYHVDVEAGNHHYMIEMVYYYCKSLMASQQPFPKAWSNLKEVLRQCVGNDVVTVANNKQFLFVTSFFAFHHYAYLGDVAATQEIVGSLLKQWHLLCKFSLLSERNACQLATITIAAIHRFDQLKELNVAVIELSVAMLNILLQQACKYNFLKKKQQQKRGTFTFLPYMGAMKIMLDWHRFHKKHWWTLQQGELMRENIMALHNTTIIVDNDGVENGCGDVFDSDSLQLVPSSSDLLVQGFSPLSACFTLLEWSSFNKTTPIDDVAVYTQFIRVIFRVANG